MKNYFYVSTSGNGWDNLALDEYLLNTVAPGELVLYLYVNSNAVIIGQNQNPWKECNISAMDADSVQLVRRVSGGGAVFHDDGNLNFSFIAHKDRYDVEKQTKMIMEALRGIGIESELSGRNDITAGGRKFSGNAYCSRGSNCQHHGTLMINTDTQRLSRYLNVSQAKLRAKGVASVRSRVCNLTDLAPDITVEGMKSALERAFEVTYGEYQPLSLTPDQLTEVAKLREKHSSWTWRMGTAPDFDYSAEERFSWGTTQLCLKVSGGLVESTKLFTDSLDITLPGKLEPLLTGARFQVEDMAQRFEGHGPEAEDLAEWVRGFEL